MRLLESKLYYSEGNKIFDTNLFCFQYDFVKRKCILLNRIDFVWEKIIKGNRNNFCSQKNVVLTYKQGFSLTNNILLTKN